jgi:hypothetical protein
VTGLANRGVFNANGRIFADGGGNLYASSVTGGLLMNTLAGTYTVSTDCSVKMTLNDPFVTTTPAPGTVLTSPTAVTLEGELSGGQIDAVVTGANAAGASVTFVRTSQFNACSNANLLGNFSVVGSGFALPATGTTTDPGTGTTTTTAAFTPGFAGTLGTPFGLLGRFTADGLGNLAADNAATPSPLKRTLTGTYTVNVDCTGTAKFIDANNTTRNASFVIVNEAAPSGSNNSNAGNQTLRFGFTDTGVIGSGTATAQ